MPVHQSNKHGCVGQKQEREAEALAHPAGERACSLCATSRRPAARAQPRAAGARCRAAVRRNQQSAYR